MVCSIRNKANYISVWNADALNHAVRFSIAETFKRIFSQPMSDSRLEYKTHQSAMKDGSTFCNAAAYRTYQAVVARADDEAADDEPAAAASASALPAAASASALPAPVESSV